MRRPPIRGKYCVSSRFRFASHRTRIIDTWFLNLRMCAIWDLFASKQKASISKVYLLLSQELTQGTHVFLVANLSEYLTFRFPFLRIHFLLAWSEQLPKPQELVSFFVFQACCLQNSVHLFIPQKSCFSRASHASTLRDSISSIRSLFYPAKQSRRSINCCLCRVVHKFV